MADINSENRSDLPGEHPSGQESLPGGEGAAHDPRARRRQRLKLPFDNRREDAGSWAYDHRIGLCVTLIAYLVLMIVFVGSRIVVGRKAVSQTMYIDLQALTDLEKQKEKLEQEVRQRQQDPFDWSSVKNRASNENALNEDLKDDRGSDAAALNDAAADAQARMQANREAWEQALAEEQRFSQRTEGQQGPKREDRKVKGRVTVSFSFVDPVRKSWHLEIPAYLCEGGGEVVVAATIDRAGKVINARVTGGGDDCMRDAALRAARLSRFNIDDSAPAKQNGTITYIFIPQ